MKKTVEIEGRVFTLRTMTVQEMLDYSNSPEKYSRIELEILSKTPLPLLAVVSDTPKGGLYQLTPDQLEQLQDAAIEVIPHFFALIDRQIKAETG